MGHQNALLAGLMTAKDHCDVSISMDADLQDDIGAIDEMIDRYNSGCDVVYGVRSKRATDTIFKRATAEGFYKLMNSLGANTVYNHADFRLMSRRALMGLAEFGEVNLFLRGIVPMVGFKSDIVYYERAERFAGESKYPLRKMLSFAIEGITSLSTKPIKMITGLGIFIFFVSILVFIYSLVRHFTGNTIPGWTTTVLSVWAIGGLIMISLGVIGEYIGKIYLETKSRPRFIIESYLGDDDNNNNQKLEM
jgi:glycosyltransferase involved in cell wall biosynthesis